MKFSVIVPLFNKEQYVEKCINSLSAQTFQDFEIVVIDDGSSDSSVPRVEQLGFSKLTLIAQENSGVSAARNRGIDIATGEYICFLDADDWYEPEFLEKISLLIDRFGAASAYCSGYFRRKGGETRKSTEPTGCDGQEMFLIDDFYDQWSRGAFFFTSSICVSRALLQATGLRFPRNEHMGEDQEMWFSLAERGPFAYVRQPLSNYTIGSSNSLTHSQKLIEEYPFLSRLKDRVRRGDVGAGHLASAAKVVQRNELERSINNSLYGRKILGARLLLLNCTPVNFATLASLAVFSLICPQFLLPSLRRAKKRFDKMRLAKGVPVSRPLGQDKET
jgi:glycosyltransferase involved in cell wall biosynthesis